jgi:hypothetical protein
MLSVYENITLPDNLSKLLKNSNANANPNMFQFDISMNIVDNVGRTDDDSTVENDDGEDINGDLSVD